MRKRITRVSPIQMGKVAAVLYFFLSIPFMFISGIMSMFVPGEERMPAFFIFAAPVLYVVLGFVFTAVGSFLYNLAARFTGGIEFVSEEVS